MFCSFCGNKIPDGSGFCPKCGRRLDASHKIETAPEIDHELGSAAPHEPPLDIFELRTENAQPEGEKIPVPDPNEEEHRAAAAKRILIFGILGLSFAVLWLFSVIGLAFSIVSKILVARYVRRFGETSGKATVGKSLGKAGFIVGIILSVFVIAAFGFGGLTVSFII